MLWTVYHTYLLRKSKQNVSIKVNISPIIEVSFSIIFVITITLTYQSKISTSEIYIIN